jgi:hypothetical protein
MHSLTDRSRCHSLPSGSGLIAIDDLPNLNKVEIGDDGREREAILNFELFVNSKIACQFRGRYIRYLYPV